MRRALRRRPAVAALGLWRLAGRLAGTGASLAPLSADGPGCPPVSGAAASDDDARWWSEEDEDAVDRVFAMRGGACLRVCVRVCVWRGGGAAAAAAAAGVDLRLPLPGRRKPALRPACPRRGAGWMWFRSRSQRADAHVCLPKAETRRLARRMTRRLYEPEGSRHSGTGRHFLVPRLQWVAATEACRCGGGGRGGGCSPLRAAAAWGFGLALPASCFRRKLCWAGRPPPLRAPALLAAAMQC
jgi:hypothetical protein